MKRSVNPSVLVPSLVAASVSGAASAPTVRSRSCKGRQMDTVSHLGICSRPMDASSPWLAAIYLDRPVQRLGNREMAKGVGTHGWSRTNARTHTHAASEPANVAASISHGWGIASLDSRLDEPLKYTVDRLASLPAAKRDNISVQGKTRRDSKSKYSVIRYLGKATLQHSSCSRNPASGYQKN
jgi:hypothetical protein